MNSRLAEVQKHSGKAAYKRTGAKWDVHNLKSYLLSTALTSGNWWKLTGSHTEVNKTVKCCRMSLFPVFLKARFFCLHELLSSCCLFFDVWRVWPSNFYSAPFVPPGPRQLATFSTLCPQHRRELATKSQPFQLHRGRSGCGKQALQRHWGDCDPFPLFSAEGAGFFHKEPSDRFGSSGYEIWYFFKRLPTQFLKRHFVVGCGVNIWKVVLRRW